MSETPFVPTTPVVAPPHETESATAAAEMQTSSATEPPESSPPIVDPRPTAAPIAVDRRSLEELLTAHPAPASSAEVLALEPNRYEDATVGPDRQISQITYVEMTKPDGTTFLSPLSNVAYYRRKGFTEGAHRDIPDLVAYWAERATRVSEQDEPVQPAQTQEPDQPPEDVLLRLAGVPKTAEELEEERVAIEEEREGRNRRGLESEEQRRRQGTPSSDHPHGGPPGQTGDHPLGGPPGQTGEHPEGGPPPRAEQLPTEEPDTTEPEPEPKAP